MDFETEATQIYMSDAQLIHVMKKYIPVKLMNNVKLPPDYKENVRHEEEMVQLMLSNSDNMLRMYGTARELLRNLHRFQNFPLSHRVFGFDPKEPYSTIPFVYKNMNADLFMNKADIYRLLQYLSVENLNENPKSEELFCSMKAILLKFYEEKFRGVCEYFKWDRDLFKNMYDGFSSYYRQILTQESSKSCEDWNNEKALKMFKAVVPVWKEQEYCGFENDLKSFFDSKSGNFNDVSVPIRSFAEYLKSYISVNPEKFLPYDKETNPNCPIVVRVFKSHGVQFVMKSELFKAINIRNPDSERLEYKNIDGQLMTMSYEEVQKEYKDRIGNIEFINYDIQRTDHKAVPIMTPSGGHCILAIDFLFDVLNELIFTHRIFQKIDSQNRSVLRRFFLQMTNFFSPHHKSIFFVTLEEQDKRKEGFIKFWDDFENIPTKYVRNVKKDGFTVQNLKNELENLGLIKTFPEIQEYAESVYSEVFITKKGALLRTIDMFKAVEKCLLYCIFKRFPNLRLFMHSQYVCHRICFIKCEFCNHPDQAGKVLENGESARMKTLQKRAILRMASFCCKGLPDSENFHSFPFSVSVQRAAAVHIMAKGTDRWRFLVDVSDRECLPAMEDLFSAFFGNDHKLKDLYDRVDWPDLVKTDDNDNVYEVAAKKIAKALLWFEKIVVHLYFCESSCIEEFLKDTETSPLEHMLDYLCSERGLSSFKCYYDLNDGGGKLKLTSLDDYYHLQMEELPAPEDGKMPTGVKIPWRQFVNDMIRSGEAEKENYLDVDPAEPVMEEDEYEDDDEEDEEEYEDEDEEEDEEDEEEYEDEDEEEDEEDEEEYEDEDEYEEDEEEAEMSIQTPEDTPKTSVFKEEVKPSISEDTQKTSISGKASDDSQKTTKIENLPLVDLNQSKCYKKCLRTSGENELTSDVAQKTSESGKASEMIELSPDDIQKANPTKKLPIAENESKCCTKCLRTSEMCNEAKKELKSTQNKLEKYEKKAKRTGEVEKELKALKMEVKMMEKEAERRELEAEKKQKIIEQQESKLLKMEANETRMRLNEKNHSIRQNELLEKITSLSEQLKKNELMESERIDELTAQLEHQKELVELMKLELKQNEESLKSQIREKERGFEELRAALTIMSNENESIQRENRNLRERIASIPEAPPTPSVPEPPLEGPTHHRFALLGFQKIKDSLYRKKQLKQAKEMVEKLKSSTDLVEIHQIADYEYYQFEGKLLKYVKEVELNIQRIKETCDVSTVTPLPDSPEFSKRFMSLYWKIINNQPISPSEIEVSDSECFICTEEMTSDQKTLQCEECKKVTHFECASQWLKIHRSCPHCRREMLDPEEFPNLGQ